jgi:hypothetical protein
MDSVMDLGRVSEMDWDSGKGWSMDLGRVEPGMDLGK